MIKDDLKPCPFCGVKPKIDIDGDDAGHEYGGSWSYASISATHEETCPLYQSYECGEDSGSIKIIDFTNEDLERFAAAWNTRAEAQAVDVEALKRELMEKFVPYFNDTNFVLRDRANTDGYIEHTNEIIDYLHSRNLIRGGDK